MSKRSPLSQEIEQSAIEQLRKFYGDSAEIEDSTDSGGCDFIIKKSNETIGIGEITWLERENLRKLNSALEKKQDENPVSLPPGSGVWWVKLEDDSHVNSVFRELPYLIVLMKALGTSSYESNQTWRKDEVANYCRWLRISRIIPAGIYSADLAFVNPKGSGGVEQHNYVGLTENIFDFLINVKPDNWAKLQSQIAHEKHIYLRLGTVIPFNVSNSLIIGESPDEICDIRFPDGITHIWLQSNSLQMRNILWRRDGENTYF